MLPVIFNIGGFTLSSFGLFLILGFIFSMFAVWRLGRIYDLDEENLSTLTLLTFFGGLISSRIFAVLLNLNFYNSLEKILFVTKYPGLSLWGGLIGGFLVIFLLHKRYKLNFYQYLDFASTAFLLGLVLGEIGCYLGGCNVGVVSNGWLSFPVVGVIGNRLAISLIEAFIFIILFKKIWNRTVRFHTLGLVFTQFLIQFSILEFIFSYFKVGITTVDRIIYLSGILSGVVGYYIISKKSFVLDIKHLYLIITVPKKRDQFINSLRKAFYNKRVSLSVKFKKKKMNLQKFPKTSKLRRLLNVKPTPENFN